MTAPPTPPPARCDGVETQVGSEKRCLKPNESFKDCATCPEMVVVPAGSFTMGSPSNEPQRYSDELQVGVSIAAPFSVGRFAITRGEYATFVGEANHLNSDKCSVYENNEWKERADRSFRIPGFNQDDRHPAVCVNWDDAKAFAAWLSKKTGKGYRLLSEAEREYVTRAGTTTPFWWGTSITPNQANYDGRTAYEGGGSVGDFRRRTVSVDTFEPNPWGLYNVHGNVWEWTEDCWNEGNAGNPGNGRPRTTGDCNRRVVRGGSWVSDPRMIRSALRVWTNTADRTARVGFRLARTLTP